MISYLNKFQIKTEIALVTGAAQGIGYAASEALAQAGAHVILADLNKDKVKAAANELESKGLSTSHLSLDVTKSKSIEEAHAELIHRHGKIDILVNNAGIGKSFEPAENMSDEVWLQTIDVNLHGLFWCCRTFGKHMLQSGTGKIVNVGSMSGVVVNRPQEQAQYNASKAAVHHLTRSLAAEWGARGVRVNAVAPTYIETELTSYAAQKPELSKYWIGGTPLGRMGRVDEVASVILFLASDASSLLTGSIVMADGGYSCW